MAIEIEPATMVHAARIVLRPGDAREIEMLGVDKMTALKASLDRSMWADAYIADGEVAAILGCGMSCMLGGHATPWVITGTPVDRHRKEFLRITRARIAELHARYGLLVNFVHADYAESLRWLRWLGFEISAPVPLGPYGAPFVKVTLGEHRGH